MIETYSKVSLFKKVRRMWIRKYTYFETGCQGEFNPKTEEVTGG
jgi:hypothetical protein